MLKYYNLELQDVSEIRGVKRWRIPRYPGEETRQQLATEGAPRELRPRSHSRSARRFGQPSGARARGSRSATPRQQQ